MPDGTRQVNLYTEATTLTLPSTVKALHVKDGASLDVVPSIETVSVDRLAKVRRFSNGTRSIRDMRDVEVTKEALEDVKSLVEYIGSPANHHLIWLPPSIKTAWLNNPDKEAIAACSSLKNPAFWHFSGQVIPTFIKSLTIDRYVGGFIPAHVTSLHLQDEVCDVPLVGDFTNVEFLQISVRHWKGLMEAKTPLPALRRLDLVGQKMTDISDCVFPDSIERMYVGKCRGAPVFPKNLRELTSYYGSELFGIPDNLNVKRLEHSTIVDWVAEWLYWMLPLGFLTWFVSSLSIPFRYLMGKK